MSVPLHLLTEKGNAGSLPFSSTIPSVTHRNVPVQHNEENIPYHVSFVDPATNRADGQSSYDWTHTSTPGAGITSTTFNPRDAHRARRQKRGQTLRNPSLVHPSVRKPINLVKKKKKSPVNVFIETYLYRPVANQMDKHPAYSSDTTY